jgi:hypothetical protein
MLVGLVRGRGDTAAAGKGRTRNCILEFDVQESVVRGLSAPGPTIGPQPLWGSVEMFVMMRGMIRWRFEPALSRAWSRLSPGRPISDHRSVPDSAGL